MTDWQRHVLPHGPLVPIGTRVWQVTGRLPRGNMPRNMVVHKLASGGLLIHSAIALDEPTMVKLAALGRPEVLIVPNSFHRLDAGVWKARFSSVRVLAPAAARVAVEKKVTVDATCEEALAEHGVKWHAPEGLKPSELWYELESGEGPVLVLTDSLMNLPHGPGVDGLLMRLLGSTGFFGLTRIGRMLLLKDRAAYKAWLLRLADTPRLKGVLVAHGEAVVERAAESLRAAAGRL